MPNPPPEFSKAQWEFLALFEALDQPLTVSLAGELVPLAPGPFLELLRRAGELGWLKQTGPDTYTLEAGLPEAVGARLREINQPRRLARLAKRLEHLHLEGRVSADTVGELLRRSGQAYQALERDYDLARTALAGRHYEEAATTLSKTLTGLSALGGTREADTLLVAASLELADLRLRLGRQLSTMPEILGRARIAALRLGDRRSRALIDLRLGRLSYVSFNLADALDSLVAGLDEVDELGDEDIVAQSSEFAGLYYFLQGMHREASRYFDRAMAGGPRHGSDLIGFFLPFIAGFCATYLGQFHRAVGILDFCLKQHQSQGDPGLAALFQSALGIVFLIMGNQEPGRALLQQAEANSLATSNQQALLLARTGLGYFHFLEGRNDEAARLMMDSITEAARADHVIRQYIFPFIPEEILAFQSLPDYNQLDNMFAEELNRIISGPNIHLRGVAYRLRARQAWNQPGTTETVRADLETSLRYLKRAGDPLEQAKTKAWLAKLVLETGDRNQAAELAREAWPHLSRYREAYFPQVLEPLLAHPSRSGKPDDLRITMLDRFLDMLEGFTPGTDLEELLTRVVMASARFLDAERGGLFWFDPDQGETGPYLRTAFNLTAAETLGEAFQYRLGLIRKAFRQNTPLYAPAAPEDTPGRQEPVGNLLCLPIEVQGRTRGVIYHDNACTKDQLDQRDPGTLRRMARQISVYIDRIWEYSRLMDKRNRTASGEAARSDPAPGQRIIGRSPVMARLLEQADQVAESEATVLILGETGVGKEMVAQRLHHQSPRSGGPFLVVDLTATPENLVESELFGHEKGAFTGADRQKPGRLELADHGTLFIDEVGEIPLFIQVKLLRALQEKSFVRLGGTRTIKSDFRLVAATNRDLRREVAAGRFREDLFYRLNVVPLNLPPLRERGEDVLILARFFLKRLADRHQKPVTQLTPADEARLMSYHWPGNVRELQNIMERAVLLGAAGGLDLVLPSAAVDPRAGLTVDLPTMDELQRRYIKEVLDKTGGRISGPGGAAEILGIKRTTLYTRMRKLGM
jgi:transcriptional regulator with GAF, ATPase, and Fis domain